MFAEKSQSLEDVRKGLTGSLPPTNTKDVAMQVSEDKENIGLVFQVGRRGLVSAAHSLMVELCMWRRERSGEGSKC